MRAGNVSVSQLQTADASGAEVPHCIAQQGSIGQQPLLDHVLEGHRGSLS